MLKNDELLQSVALQESKIKDAVGLINFAMEDSFLIKEINTLLKTTRNPTKLAYIRWPVYEIFNFITDRYQ